MKKTFIYAFLSAIALSGATGFTSCSDKEELAADNPNYDPNTNSVVVDLALNISTSNTPTSTRQSSDATQATENARFRGISTAQLFSFHQDESGKHLAAPMTFGKRYDLSQLVTAGQISTNNSRRVLEMSLPIQTNTLVFYGKATEGTSTSTEYGKTAKDLYGSLEPVEANSEATNMSQMTFSLSQRLAADKLLDYRKTEKLLAGILTCIMNTNLSNLTPDVGADDVAGGTAYGFALTTAEMSNIHWYNYANAEKKSPVTPAHDLYALEDQLAKAYIQMTTIRGNDGELRAASGQAILQTITDLWSIVNKVRCAAPLSKEEAVAKRLASAIDEEIRKYFRGTVPDGGVAVTGVTFVENMSTILDFFLSDKYWPIVESEPENSDYVRANLAGLNVNLANFPNNFGLPNGATHVKFDTAKKLFSYPEDFNSSAVGDVPFTVLDYLYPPELTYFGNSSIRVSNNPHQVTEYPNGANANEPVAASGDTPAKVGGWNNESSWPIEDWSSNYVTSASRSVAMKNDINYGTALLKTTVKLGATTLRDNNHAVQVAYGVTTNNTTKDDGEYNVEPDNKLTVDDTSFELIGVIVGGQSKHVGWDFLPKKVTVNGSEVYEYGFVNDCAIPDDAQNVTTGGSGANYTLLFDNYDASKELNAQNKVYVALEFKNNSGQDFYGNYNLIRNGGTFYLIGELDTTKAGLATPTWPTYHALPPYNDNGSSKQAVRVFMQDYMTTANFVIGVHSLKYAYLTVPDLRSSSLTLGLSVDIKWETGLNFGDVTLGKNDF